MASQPDALAAAMDAIRETLQDWDGRHDWRFTQVVASDISISSGTTSVDLPNTFKKPYVAYLNTSKQPLFYIERGNWHRMFPGTQTTSIPGYYTLYNVAAEGKADIFWTSSVSDTVKLLFYRSMLYDGDEHDVLDIPARWEGYVLAGSRMRLVAMKIANDKAMFWEKRYEMGIKQAKEDDRRMPDQFLSFEAPSSMSIPPYWNNINSTWESWGSDG